MVRLILTCLFFLSGCQTTNTSATPVSLPVPDQYQSVIDGGLGVRFDDPISKLEEMGFEENIRPRKQYEVGDWKIPFSQASGFFNFGMEASTSPSTGRIYSIQGYRAYSGEKYPNHFNACREDFTLLLTKIEAKYRSLHKWYEPGLNISGKHANVSFHEGKGSYAYSSSPRLFGRSIYLACSIQTRNDVVFASLLTVQYSEDSEKTKALRAEQKRVFEDLSGDRLEEKGINSDDL